MKLVYFDPWLVFRIQRRRTRVMLGLAWVLAPLCSLPQSFLFKLRRHPLQPDYAQCTTIGSFTSEEMVNSQHSLALVSFGRSSS